MNIKNEHLNEIITKNEYYSLIFKIDNYDRISCGILKAANKAIINFLYGNFNNSQIYNICF